MSAPLTAAVVLNWNGADVTVNCVRALLRSVPVAPRLIVVDNGSTDGSVARIEAACPGVTILQTGRNLGYAGGNNVGIRAAMAEGAERIVLLNNDVEVDPHCVARLSAALDDDAAVGIAGPMVLMPGEPQRIWAAGGALSHRENISRLRGYGQVPNGQYREDEDVDYLPGCVAMVRREVFERVGLLDEAFFCYMEDVDFGRRAAALGFRNRYVASAVAVHEASSSTGGGYTPARKYMNAVNSVRFLRRHPSLRGWAGFLVFDVLGLPACLVVAIWHGRPRAALAKLHGIVDGLLGRPVTPERVARYLGEVR